MVKIIAFLLLFRKLCQLLGQAAIVSHFPFAERQIQFLGRTG